MQLFTDENYQGNVAVLSPGGVPRAVMKAMAKGGAITAVSPEGQPRAILHSLEDKGEVVIFREKALAKLFAGDAGGTFCIFDNDGESACSLMTTPAGNGLFVHPPGENHTISLVATQLGSSLHLGQTGEGEEQAPAVDLHDLPGHGGQILCRDKNGQIALDLGTASEGGKIMLANETSGGRVQIHTNEGGGVIEAARTDSDQRILLTAAPNGAVATLVGENDTAAFMQITKPGGMFGFKKGEHLQGMLGAVDDGDFGALMLTNPDNSNAANLVANKTGGNIILGGNDGTILAALATGQEGSQLTLFSELGIERASLIAKQDSGGLHLRFGGHSGIVAAASDRGGIVVAHDKEGAITETFPSHGWQDETED